MIYFKAPTFWYNPQSRFFPTLLTPIEWGVTRVTEARADRHAYAWKAPIPVLCCGNITTGGTGKTTVVIDFAHRLMLRGKTPHILTRGYKGRYTSTHFVNCERDTAYDVGDEALLLAKYCPVWVGADRVKTARAAINAGADCL
ncbi:MAG: tetraacyldisaccharide 4'-kinase, partial [Acetobacter sp.]|nr:tetraacyldisaccharide 4'-kinase [Acetobacter sp.]